MGRKSLGFSYTVQTDEVVVAMAGEKAVYGVHIVRSKGDAKGSSADVTVKVQRTPRGAEPSAHEL